MVSTFRQFLCNKKIHLAIFTQVALYCLLLVTPVSSITASREIFTFVALAGVLLLLLSGVRRIVLDPVWFFWMALFIVALLSLLSAADVQYSLSTIRRELLKGALMFFIGLYAMRGINAYGKLWLFILFCIALMSICGVLLFLPNLTFNQGWHIIEYGRAASLSNGYGHFASYLAIMTPFLLVAPQALNFKSKRAWIVWLIILLATVFSAYFTATRILWAAMLISGVLYFWFMSRKRLLVAAVGAALLAGLIWAVVALPQHSHGEQWYKVFDNPEQMQGTAGDLAMLWSFSYDKLSENPFKGVGFGKNSFIKAYPEFLADKSNPALLHTHNVFVDAAMQMGVQGMLALLALFLALLKGLWPQAPPAAGDIGACFRMAAVLAIISYVLRNQVDEYFIDDSQLLFWLIMGLAWATRYFNNTARVADK